MTRAGGDANRASKVQFPVGRQIRLAWLPVAIGAGKRHREVEARRAA